MDTPIRNVWLDDSPSPVWLKLEGHNPSGSIKDRLAAHVLSSARADGALRPGTTVVEVSTGNTGIALSRVSRLLGVRCEVLLPASVRAQVVERIRDYGGIPVLLPDELGPEHAMREAHRRAMNGHFWPDQSRNPLAKEAYEGLAFSIVRQVPAIDCLVCGVGTGGTLLGTSSGIRATGVRLHVIGVVPADDESIEGLRPTGVPAALNGLYQPTLCDEVVRCSRAEAAKARRLLGLQGIRCGLSGGAVYHIAMRIARSGRFRGIVGICADGIDVREEGVSST